MRNSRCPMANTNQVQCRYSTLTSIRNCVLLDESQGGISPFRLNSSVLLLSAFNSIFPVNAKPSVLPGIDCLEPSGEILKWFA